MRAYHIVTGRISSVVSIDFEHETALLRFNEDIDDIDNVKCLFPSRENVPCSKLIIMNRTNSVIMCSGCNKEVELYEYDVLKIKYRDYITNEEREAFGIVALDEIYGISLDFPQYETTISLSDEEIVELIHLGTAFDNDVIKEISDEKLVEIIKEWKKEEIKESAKILQFSK